MWKAMIAHTGDKKTWLYWLINRVCGGQYVHSLIGFAKPGGDVVYFEALPKAGWSGPKSWYDLLNWSTNPNHVIDVQELPYPSCVVEDMYNECSSMVGKYKYAMGQLIRNYMLMRLGFSLDFMRRSTSKEYQVTCSEGVAIVGLPINVLMNYILKYRWSADDIVPDSPKKGAPALRQGVQAYLHDFHNGLIDWEGHEIDGSRDH